MLLIIVVEWIAIHSTPYLTSYHFTTSILSVPSTSCNSHCSLALLIIEPKAVVHCSLGIISHSVDTLDTCVEATSLAPDLGVIATYLLAIDHAKLPLDGVSPVVSQNPQ